MKFAKWHGIGNDFIIINRDDLETNSDIKSVAKAMCDRNTGIGADSIILLSKIDNANFNMIIYTSDGGETEMCGNASRCVALYIDKYQLSNLKSFNLHTVNNVVTPEIVGVNLVRVNMNEPIINNADIILQNFQGSDISMGNPHFVTFVNNIEEIDVEHSGKLLENDLHFPNRSNIEFAQVIDKSTVRMRVWERGCGITLACGTGSSACCVAGVLQNKTERKIKVILDGGTLDLEWNNNDNCIYMQGLATEVFNGSY